MTLEPPLISIFSILPLRALTSPTISPKYSSGDTTSKLMMGSKRTGAALEAASLKAKEPAILKAIDVESTSWKEPSKSVTFISDIGKPAKIPVSMASLIPASMEEMNSLGIAPPLIRSTNSNPLALTKGSTVTLQWPYWPRPPVCLIYLPSPSASAVIVSL